MFYFQGQKLQHKRTLKWYRVQSVMFDSRTKGAWIRWLISKDAHEGYGPTMWRTDDQLDRLYTRTN